ncbi:MAG: hypothetical protein JXJ04_08725, partial [Spirochaetales bacterium]|nr:hypothetical protein [Spirochaetales bacterium]
MNKSVLVFLLLISCLSFVYSQSGSDLPSEWKIADIGDDMIPMTANYSDGTYIIEGNDPAKADTGFHFVYQTMSSLGNGDITVRINGKSADSKAGVMIRESLDPGAPFVSTHLSRSGDLKFSSRISQDGTIASSTGISGSTPYWVKLVKDGDVFTGSVSPNGTTWTEVESAIIDMEGDIHIGLYVDTTTQEFSAEFDSVAIGYEMQANGYESYDSYNPAIAGIANGYVIAWNSTLQDGSGTGVYGQRFDINGNKLGNEFQINTYTDEDQYKPWIAEIPEGFVVVWCSMNQDGSGSGIYGQRFDTNGNKLGNEFLINTYTNSSQTNPNVVALGDNFIVVWESNSQDGSGPGIYGQRFDTNG